MRNGNLTGVILALSAASVFALTPAVATAGKNHDGKSVQCHGVNACKGKSSCKSNGNSCQGKNACKGEGYVKMSKKQCDQIGGKTGSNKDKSDKSDM